MNNFANMGSIFRSKYFTYDITIELLKFNLQPIPNHVSSATLEVLVNSRDIQHIHTKQYSTLKLSYKLLILSYKTICINNFYTYYTLNKNLCIQVSRIHKIYHSIILSEDNIFYTNKVTLYPYICQTVATSAVF